MMVISKRAFGSDADSARVAAQIVAGVGFLGAGMIVYKKNVVHGLTTVVLIFIQWCLHRKIFAHKRLYSIKIVFVQKSNEREQIKKIFDIDRYNRLIIERQGEELVYQAILDTDEEYSSAQLDEIMQDNKYILSIERCDES